MAPRTCLRRRSRLCAALATVLLSAAAGPQAHAQSRGVVVPVPDAIARGLAVVGALTGTKVLVDLKAPSTPPFGTAGQLVLGATSQMLLYGEHQQLGSFHNDVLHIDAGLDAGRFIARNVLVSLLGGYGLHVFDDAATPATGRIGAGGSYNMAFHEHASLLPTLSVLYATHAAQAGQNAARARHHLINLSADITFVMQLGHHVALTLSPFVMQSVFHRVSQAPLSAPLTTAARGDFNAAAKATWNTTYGVKVGVLTWF